ncbi:MAG: 3-isopropylmalate dehydratase small subunit [Actinobacteria bacterium]|nr:3-isopropylmalate dehydratase small subunit [Actinomycetota bacterium]
MLKGKAHKYGKNVDTDVIIPARYLNVSDPDELASHCMEDIDPDFKTKMKSGDFIVALENFGCGSSREHAPIAIKQSGVSAVIAKSFARIFFRNAINIGLPLLVAPEAASEIDDGDELEVDLKVGYIKDLTKGKEYAFNPYPDFMVKIINAGGYKNMIKRDLSEGV